MPHRRCGMGTNLCLCKYWHIAVLLTQFPVWWANNLRNYTKVASGCSATSALTNGSAFFRWLNCGFPLCFGCKLPSVFWRFTSFWTRLLLTPNLVATFLIDIFSAKWAFTIFCRRSREYAFIRFDYNNDILVYLITAETAVHPQEYNNHIIRKTHETSARAFPMILNRACWSSCKSKHCMSCLTLKRWKGARKTAKIDQKSCITTCARVQKSWACPKPPIRVWTALRRKVVCWQPLGKNGPTNPVVRVWIRICWKLPDSDGRTS